MDDVYPVIVSFVLVTVIGGLFGTWLQQRTWAHKWMAEQRTRRRDAALGVFETVSTLMDKRLFRLEQLRLWTERGDEERFEHALAEYRDVLAEWNDNISRILAKQQIYLGKTIREQFDNEVGKKFVDAGAALEVIIRARGVGTHPPDTAVVKRLIGELRSEVYEFNLAMLRRVEALDETGA